MSEGSLHLFSCWVRDTCSGVLRKLFQHFIGLGADHACVAHCKRGHAGDAFPSGLGPVAVHRIFEPPFFQDITRGCWRKPDRLCDVNEHAEVANIPALCEVRAIDGVVNRLEAGSCVRPLTELLRQTTVVGVGSWHVRQPLCIQETLEARMNGTEIASTK